MIILACLVVIHHICDSPFGATLKAIRDAPSRAKSIGIDVRRFQLVAFMMAAFFAGIAGSLYVFHNRGIFPQSAHWTTSVEIMLMAVLGGANTFVGPIVGAVFLKTLEFSIPRVTEYWLFFLGIIVLLIAFAMPRGLLDGYDRLQGQAQGGGRPVTGDILRTDKLNRQFGGVHAARDVSIAVPPGQIRAIIGPNGAGKSTLFNLLTGYLRPQSGSIYFKGKDVTGMAPHQLCRMGLVRTFQLPNVFSNATVLENIQLGRVSLGAELWRMFTPFRQLRVEESEEILSLVGLTDHARVQASNLPFGDHKKLELAIALACDPQLLLLDEPTAGMPLHERPALIGLVQSIVRAKGLTTVLIEHDMDLVFSIADKITVLNRGTVVAEGTPDEVRAMLRCRESIWARAPRQRSAGLGPEGRAASRY